MIPIPAWATTMTAKLVGVGLITLALGGVYWWITDSAYDRGAADMKAKWVESANKWKAYTERLDAKYRADTASLQAAADTLRNQKDKDDAKNRADVERLVGELRRERNRRPAGPMPAAAIAPGTGRPGTCTAADLYADDAEAFTRFAGRTESVNNQLRQCWSLYNKARATLNQGAAP